MNNHFSSLSRTIVTLFFSAIAAAGIAQSAVDSLPPVDSLSDRQVNEYCGQLAAKIDAFLQNQTEQARLLMEKRSELEQAYADAQNDSSQTKAFRDSLKNEVKIAKSLEKKAFDKQKDVQKLSALAQKTAEDDNVAQRKNLSKIWKSWQKITVSEMKAAEPETQETPVKPKKSAPKSRKKREAEDAPVTVESKEEKDVAEAAPAPVLPPSNGKNQPPKPPKAATGKYDPDKDVMLNPPDLPCTWAQEKKDEFSGEIYRRTEAFELFRSTPAQLKSFLEGKPNVVCDAALASTGDSYSLLLKFTIYDPNPRKSFGKLDRNSLLLLLLMDGSQYNLNNQISSEGVPGEDGQSLIFQGQYPLTPEIYRKLKRTELDRIRVAWSSGYEDYDVQYVHLLMQLGKCF